MKHLKDILDGMAMQEYQLHGASDVVIEQLSLDSRVCKKGGLFAALRGSITDGHEYISAAASKGSNVFLVEELPEDRDESHTYIQVANSAIALGHLAASFYDHPSRSLSLVGVTGTNGKTSTASILKQAFSFLGHQVGLLSTVQNEIGNERIPATHTTPNAIALQELLYKMVEAGCNYAFMEVSSHALDQERHAGTEFAGAIFTNLSRDHLDYHETFDAYLKAKKKLFDGLSKEAFALSNSDDKNGKVMLQNSSASNHYYSLKKPVEFKAKILEQDFSGMQLDINGHQLYAGLIGQFNAYNLLAAFGAMCMLDIEEETALKALSSVKAAEGRFDWMKSDDGKVGIVDFAHTPDALEKVLKTIVEINGGAGRLISVFGCGGDRDKGKRPEMGKIAAEYADQLVLTSDNPRTEDPDAILADIAEGIPLHKQLNVLSISNRRSAIQTAVQLAAPGDTILVAGKGHEKYQEINGRKEPFDDKAILSNFLMHQKA